MRIVAPVSTVEEVAPLAAAGADEFYCGIVPKDWTDRFKSSGVNRRIFGNFSDYGALAEAVAAAHAAGTRVSLVMNAQHYSEAHIAALQGIAERFAGLGGDALIVGDLGLLATLAEQGLPLRLHVSSLLTCRNSEAMKLYRDLGAQRVILPRDVTLGEIAAMARAVPGIELEAFVLNDGCVFEEGSCHSIHLPPKLGGPICLDRYDPAYARCDGAALSEAEAARLKANDEAYRRFLWHRFSRGFTVSEDGYPFGPCGLCALPAFARAGLAAVKIAGREGRLERKLKSVELVRTIRDRVRDGASEAEVLSQARGMRGAPCTDGYMCYYRETAPTS